MRRLGSQAGQMVTEAILIMVVLVAFTFLVGRYFREQEVLRQLISAPWVNLAGLLQNGVWLPKDRGTISHPNGHTRHITIQGENAR